jgi:hypothetical protein
MKRNENENKLHIGTWDVLTLSEPGKMQETHTEMLALQEIRWTGNGIINKKDYTI